MSQTSTEIATRVGEILDAHHGMEGSLLPILHAIQHAYGYVPRDALPIIAKRLNLSKAEVHGVMSFYHDFREDPAGRHVLKLCRAEACQAMGSDRVAAHAKGALGIEWHETTADGAVTLDFWMVMTRRFTWQWPGEPAKKGLRANFLADVRARSTALPASDVKAEGE